MSAPPSPSKSSPEEQPGVDSAQRDESPSSATPDKQASDDKDGANDSSDASAADKPPAAPSSPAKSVESQESGEASPIAAPEETDSSAPPLPNEAPPPAEDDGWDFHWDATHQAYYFYNRFTHITTWDNPRLSGANTAAGASAPARAPGIAEPPKDERPPAGGYNPAVHGDYDPNAWYAKTNEDESAAQTQTADPAAAYAAMGNFNRATGRWQAGDINPDNHNDEAKSRRQMNAYFDVDAAANSHDGRSLKAERSGKKPTKAELKAFKEKRRAKKEEKRRAWLRD